MAYYHSRTFKKPFDDVLSNVTQSLQQQGFGIITTIDVTATLKQKLNIDFRNYKILGACNPEFAYKAITNESHIGLMLPCNIVVQEHEDGQVEVSAINPAEIMNKSESDVLQDIAKEVGSRLRVALDDLYRDTSTLPHGDALPVTSNEETNIITSFPG